MSGSNHSDETPDHEQPTEPTRPAGYGQPVPEHHDRRRNWPFFAGVLAGIFLVCVLAALLLSQRPLGVLNPANPQATPTQQGANVQIDQIRRKVADSVKPTIVQINVKTSSGGSLGSGIIIDKRGYVVTNNHVVENGQNVEVQLASGEQLPAQIRGTDPTDDLAVLQIKPTRNMPVATLGDSSRVYVGETVMAIGNPLGITQTVTSGIVSALNRIVSEGSGGAVLPDTIQTDAAINPGNSGGALVDMNGNVVGVPTLAAIDPEFKTPASGVGFAIPANRVKFIVPQIIKDGRVTNSGRAALGITALPLTPFIAQQRNLSVTKGLLVAEVQAGGAAEQAGIQPGDVITQIDNVSVEQNEDVSHYLLTKKPGDKVTVRYVRDNNRATALVTLGELQIPTT
ncbi:protease [Ktedonobacter sp. SOSP1-52]|uniref:S1C family serine protease n=1 Tax=Ktedonobacter sp. SOSP1-52 TaxID=2778366 RepID=UPI0019159A10|nr:trypsin-like peptidase domain-containing protein [Ktedonobacter sp. SOSP1-52]GHO71018.1 protease [Ktedonobacter sp. SOSP1-52]